MTLCLILYITNKNVMNNRPIQPHRISSVGDDLQRSMPDATMVSLLLLLSAE